MSNIFSYYTKYKDYVSDYYKWNQELDNGRKSSDNFAIDKNSLKNKAKAIADPLLLLDKYEHEKAEDSETFFQTCNIELMSISTALLALPATITKAIPLLNKHADKSEIAKKASELLTRYKDKTINVLSKKIPLPKAATLVSAIAAGVLFARGINKSMKSQLGLIRKASFDATQNIVNDPQMYAVLTPEQEKQVQKIVKDEETQNSALLEKLKDKVSLSTTFQSVNDYSKNNSVYLHDKDKYMNSIHENKHTNISQEELKNAKEDKVLFENYVKNVEHDVLEPLRKVETVANITYSAMFTGGFLEYLISDKLVDVLGIKNKKLAFGIKIGVPLLTYLILNKNISDIENKAILATKYKHLKKFTENPDKYENSERNKKQPLFKFLKDVRQDMKEYDKFSQNELPKIEERLIAKKQVKLSPQQERDAKCLQKNTSMVINNQRERLYEQSVGIKALSETILGPLDIVATAVGGYVGHQLSKTCKNKTLAGMLTGIGAIVAFIPAAIVEAKLTKQQKLAEKTSVMLSLNDMQDVRKFALNENASKNDYKNQKADIFKDFLK